MRLIKALLILMFIAFGAIFGALNRDPVRIELGFLSLDSSLGISLLLAVLVGALLAGLVLTAGVIWPQQLRLRRGQAAADATAPADVPESHD